MKVFFDMKALFFKINMFLIILGFALVGMAFTGGHAAAEDSEAQCTKSDLREIKTFNVKAKSKLKDYDALVASVPDMASVRDAKDFTEDANRIIEFFRSEEFAAMEDKYEGCGMVIPRPKSKQSFWIPEEQRVYYNGI